MLSYFPIIDQRESCKIVNEQIQGVKRNVPLHMTANIKEADAILVGGGD